MGISAELVYKKWFCEIRLPQHWTTTFLNSCSPGYLLRLNSWKLSFNYKISNFVTFVQWMTNFGRSSIEELSQPGKNTGRGLWPQKNAKHMGLPRTAAEISYRSYGIHHFMAAVRLIQCLVAGLECFSIHTLVFKHHFCQHGCFQELYTRLRCTTRIIKT